MAEGDCVIDTAPGNVLPKPDPNEGALLKLPCLEPTPSLANQRSHK